MADTELRRRHPDAELPPLHPEAEAGSEQAEPDSVESEADHESAGDRRAPVRDDLTAALAAAREAQRIIAERERQADREAGLAGDDVMRRREADGLAGSLGPAQRRPPGA